MDAVRVPRLREGRARTRPDAVMGGKAYSSRANRSLLRGRGIKAVIPEPSGQIGHRKRRGSRGGRPVNFDSETYKGATPAAGRRVSHQASRANQCTGSAATGPDPALVPDGHGSAGGNEPDVRGNVQGCFIRYLVGVSSG